MQERFLLKRQSKLKSSTEIRELFSFKHGAKVIRRDLVDFRYRVSSDIKAPYQVAFLVGKRIIPKAHNRNFIKRRLREAFRLHQHRVHSSKGFQLLVIYRSRKIHSYDEIKGEVMELLDLLQDRIDANV